MAIRPHLTIRSVVKAISPRVTDNVVAISEGILKMGDRDRTDRQVFAGMTVADQAELIEELNAESASGFTDIFFRNPNTGQEKVLPLYVLDAWRSGRRHCARAFQDSPDREQPVDTLKLRTK